MNAHASKNEIEMKIMKFRALARDAVKGNLHMMVYQEKIAPPLVPLTEAEQIKLKIESVASEDRWVKNFIDRLAGVIET